MIPFVVIEIPKALEELCFSTSYFRDELVTIRDCLITIDDIKMQSHSSKIPKKSNQGKKDAKVRSSILDGGEK